MSVDLLVFDRYVSFFLHYAFVCLLFSVKLCCAYIFLDK